jgi:membrane-bound inhibitor of C-type lysozyme
MNTSSRCLCLGLHLCAFAASLALASAAVSARPSVEKRADYQCDGGTGFRVRYVGNIAELRLPGGQSVRLHQQLSGSGFNYQGAGYTLRGKGDAVTLIKAPTTVPDMCHVMRQPR